MYHVLTLLKRVSTTRAQAHPTLGSHKSDHIVAPGSLDSFDKRARGPHPHEKIPIPSKLVVLAVVELLLPAFGLVLGLQLWSGSWWWLLLGAGTLLSVLVGYAFRSDIQLHPLDLLQR
jgi:hypothetical protein